LVSTIIFYTKDVNPGLIYLSTALHTASA